MMRSALSLIAFIFLYFNTFAQTVTLSGTVNDSNGQPIPFATVLVKNTSKGSSANSDGQYALNATTGNYEILFKAIGYRQETRQVNLTGNQVLNIRLSPESYQLQNVVVKSGGEDPAYAIIRKAIRKRKSYLTEVRSYTCDTYVKGLQKLLAAPKKFLGRDINQIARELGLDSNRKGIIYLSESESKLSFMQPNLYHEEMVSSKVSGSNRAFSFNRASDLRVNLYENLQNWEGLSNRPLISPIADNALSYYNFKYMGETIESGETINRIRVTPKRQYEPTFEGYIYIIEDSWRIHSLDLYLTKSSGINFVDTITIKQQYIPVENKTWMPSSLKFEFNGGIFGFKFGGYFVAIFKNYDVNPQLSKKGFAEVMKVTADVNKKDSAYWLQARPIPLTDEEKTDYQKKAVLAKKRESKPYLDSLDRIYNKVKLSELLLTGINIRNRYNKSYFRSESVLSSLLYNTVEGVAINYGIGYTKQIDSLSNKYLRIGARVRYGFSNQLLHGSINGTIPVKDFTFSFNAGSDVVDLNNLEPITPFSNTTSSLFFRRNFQKLYDKHFAAASVSHRIAGGWTASVSAEAADRKWLDNTSYFSFFNKQRSYTSNNPFIPNADVPVFENNQSFKVNVRTSYNFSNRYVTYPSGRYYLASEYPTLTLAYTKGIKSVFGSDVDYDLLTANLTKEDISLGLYGTLSFYLGAGKFLNNNKVYYTDYKHFAGNEIILYKRAINAFLMLDYYDASTARQYLEGHMEHNFGGVLLSKVPVIRKFKLQELLELNYLTTPNLKNYTELGIGFKYLAFRILYGWSFNSGTNSKSAFRIDIGF
jgi:hypothetical protein